MKYLFILFSTFLFAQRGIEVEYKSEINRENIEATENELYLLSSTDTKSLYLPKKSNNSDKYVKAPALEKKWYNKKHHITAYKVSPTNTVYSTDNLVYKDFVNGNMYANRILLSSRAVVDESNIDLSWDIVNSGEPIDILGYDCQKAFTKFRGRTYVAYFSSKLPFPDGPYKFKGLPGLILKVESTDGYYKAEATNINLINNISIIENPFLDDKIISLETFKKITKETLIKRLKASKSIVNDEESGPIEIHFNDQLEDIGMEVIIVD
jgi:GLPGLI family protein